MASIAYTSGPTFADGEGLDMASGSGWYCIDVAAGGTGARITLVGAPAVNGYGTTDFGDDVGNATAEILYIGASEAAVRAAGLTDLSTIARPLDVSIGGVAYGVCISKGLLGQPKRTGFGKYFARGQLSITKIRAIS